MKKLTAASRIWGNAQLYRGISNTRNNFSIRFRWIYAAESRKNFHRNARPRYCRPAAATYRAGNRRYLSLTTANNDLPQKLRVRPALRNITEKKHADARVRPDKQTKKRGRKSDRRNWRPPLNEIAEPGRICIYLHMIGPPRFR